MNLEKSYYSDYFIKADNVYIECVLTLVITSEQDRYIYIYANFENDELLLEEPVLAGYQNDFETDVFIIKPGEN